jgi:Gas vesicle synthesis protein GvpO
MIRVIDMAHNHHRGVQFARRAMDTLAELVGCPAERITGIRRNDDGWVVEVEVLEVERVPETSDVLASYGVEIDNDGEIVEFRRLRRYLRAQTEGVLDHQRRRGAAAKPNRSRQPQLSADTSATRQHCRRLGTCSGQGHRDRRSYTDPTSRH